MTGPVAWMGVSPGSQPPVSDNLVHPAAGNFTNAIRLCKSTRVDWIQSKGDWIDGNGVLNGSTPTLTGTGTSATIDISSLPYDLIIQGARITSVTIDGVNVTSSCFYTDSGSNNSLSLPNATGDPVIVPQATPGATMVLAFLSNNSYTWRVDRVAEPAPADPLPYIGAYTAPDIWSIPCTSDNAILTTVANTTYASPICLGTHSYGTDSYGIDYVEWWVRASDLHPRLTNIFIPLPNVDEVYVQWLEWIGADVWGAMAEIGIKQSGPGRAAPDNCHVIMEHSGGSSSGSYPWPKNPRNSPIIGQDYYLRDVLTGGANPRGNKAFCLKLPERWYVNEIRMKMNSVGQTDGIAQMWVNGNLICDELHQWRTDAANKINSMQFQLYHGGTGVWLALAHYRQAMVSASSQYIGVPPILSGYVPPTVPDAPTIGTATAGDASASVAFTAPGDDGGSPITEYTATSSPGGHTGNDSDSPIAVSGLTNDQAYTFTVHATNAVGDSAESSASNSVTPTSGSPPAFPAWRQGMTNVGTWYQISGTSSLNGCSSDAATIRTWNGLACGAHHWYTFLNGGHGAMENKFIGIDLSQDAPTWVTLNPGSTDASVHWPTQDSALEYYTDGLPAARHTGFTIHVIPSRNRVMAFSGYAVGGTDPTYTRHVDGALLASPYTYDAAGTWADAPFMQNAGASSYLLVSRDPRNDNIYMSGYGHFAKWTQTTNAWSTITPQNLPLYWTNSWEFKGGCVDAARNRWFSWNCTVQSGSFREAGISVLDLTTYDASNHVFSGDYQTSWHADDYSVVVHDLDNDRYLCARQNVLYACDPDTYVTASLGSLPVAAANGVHSRIAYFEELGGIAYLPDYQYNIYFMPTR